MIENARAAYSILRTNRDYFIIKIVDGVKKIDDFIQDKIVTKFQKLKDGVLYIKSQTNL